ncbi:PadR family transcriptional regulator [Sphingomonadaceae bacterium]|nr:PadR family transcriptional regulator [Sphingomonadaceae bacterium]
MLQTPQKWQYGYDLIEETGLKSGTLYPLLIRLRDQGYLESEWRPSPQASRPPRHVYRLTKSGLALAHDAQCFASSRDENTLGFET